MKNSYEFLRERIDNAAVNLLSPKKGFKPKLFGDRPRSDQITIVDEVEYISGGVLRQALCYLPPAIFGDIENRALRVADVNFMVNIGRIDPPFSPVAEFPAFDCRTDTMYMTVDSALHGAGIDNECSLNLTALSKMMPTFYTGNGCSWLFSDRNAWLLYEAVTTNKVVFSLLDPALNSVCHGRTVEA